ncbi:hypothetical protein GCM10022225_51150 [Plantactinospora mayteni]|uniref:Uncharacterized protein n=1 Tax=Plantactinospora mayteni TaxID=566021 RepID=A0ABQ4F459_9ACTN|nr:hypothetical protein Pma05_82780 [Plantactinospora mayteni]
MTSGRWQVAAVADLQTAYGAWPGTPYKKSFLLALILRVRVEQVVEGLPPTVIAGTPASNRVNQRLMLTLGEPGLRPQAQEARMQVVRSGLAVYKQICDVLHGRVPDPYIPLADVPAWTAAVEALEREFAHG